MLMKFHKFSCKNFSYDILKKDKKLAEMFKLPNHKLPKEVFDRDEEREFKNFTDENYDKVDMMNKILKRKEAQTNTKFNKFFNNISNNQEQIKISENLVEKLRLKKEFKYNEDFKQK
jgi:hypothetical protein